jgi:hypothetical protein
MPSALSGCLHDTGLEPTDVAVDLLPVDGVPVYPSIGNRTSRCCHRRHICIAPFGQLARFSRERRPEGSQPGFPWGDVATPIRPISRRLSLAPSSFTRRPIGVPYGTLSPGELGRRRAYHVPKQCPRGLGPAFPPVALGSAAGENGAPAPSHVPFWFKPDSIFGLSDITTVTAVHLS